MKNGNIILIILLMSLNCFSQNFKGKFYKINKNKQVTNEKENVVYEATKYIFSNKPNQSEDFIYATKIAGFWMNLDTEYGMPTFGEFYESLTVKGQKFLFTTAMMYYLIKEKKENNRTIINIKKEGVKYSELETVKQTQLEGAKILLEYIDKKDLIVSSKTKKFLEKFKKGKLQDYFFK